MKLFAVISKSLKEQVRSYWVLLLTLSMGPFFIFVYYLIVESSKPQYDILFVNNDKGVVVNNNRVNHGERLINYFTIQLSDTAGIPFRVKETGDRNLGVKTLKEKHADALLTIPEMFSENVMAKTNSDSSNTEPVEFMGDLTNTSYLISAVWAGELLNDYMYQATGKQKMVSIAEIPLGSSGTLDDFNLVVPGILVVSLIMLMFTSSIAFVSEVENKTIMRLKLSGVTTLEFLGGIGVVQISVGVVSMLLTLLTAILLGFQYEGSLGILLLIAALTSMSIIAFSLVIASVTKSANEVLIVGNFPMFLFMFFTGAAFPLKSEALFTLAGYPINVQGLMTPVHAISALNKALVMNMSLLSILPEIIAILLLTLLYFIIGAMIFRHRHLKLA
ncbi:MAG: ABC transporter permease [Bacteroidales bacterium]|nr:ABC transporter permease [Bacteroidales bacterium]